MYHDEKPHDECGVFGLFSPVTQSLAQLTYYGLFALQHRGQESCGIVVCDDGLFTSYKDMGLVSQVMTHDIIGQFPDGNMALGHVRYGTIDSSDRNYSQPLVVNHVKGRMALAHNGKITNAFTLRRSLELDGSIFHTRGDAELISYIIIKERLVTSSIEDAVNRAMDKLEGAYSMAIMSPSKLIAVRDPYGLHPLCIGRKSDGTYVVSSESCALNAIDAEFIRDVDPGEIIVFSKDSVRSIRDHCGKVKRAPCIFEHIYTARPDSVIDGVSVHEARLRGGACLARRHPVDADVVIGVPDSGLDAALGYARESGIPYGVGFIKNRYIGRTFIEPGQSYREGLVRIKLSPMKCVIEGKRVVMIDDSIVRGTTCARIVKLLREAGAAEVHVRICSPMFMNPCYYGTDIDSKENLISYRHNVDEIRQIIGADTLGYLSLEDLGTLIGDDGSKSYCSACFDALYPTSIPGESETDRFEFKISESRGNA
ncbi:MAG: amidophosphoribosyltransferase [Oscillospiraceae bacterium]|nr:amidophosphoribosyltransferase [Oscillospiraceae bacterium]